jgi:hypothetical protein
LPVNHLKFQTPGGNIELSMKKGNGRKSYDTVPSTNGSIIKWKILFYMKKLKTEVISLEFYLFFHKMFIFGSQGAVIPPTSLHTATASKTHLKEEITPPPPHWDSRAILANHIKFRTCSDLVPM